ncbi:MAG TPA: hypothetical protein VKU40_04385, partial [Thermoanaerobaculia bacterium]|nr:hypothetical protein [Thermoanaerobaculia bacterium]
MQVGEGGTRTLCAVEVPRPADADAAEVLLAARDAVDASAECAAAGVHARVQGLETADPPAEDDRRAPQLVLEAPGIVGSLLMPGFAVPPGRAEGACFQAFGLGVPTLGQLLIAKLELATDVDGADGGRLEVTE